MLFTLIGFAAQVCLILSITAIVISCATVPHASSAVTNATCIPCAEVTASSNDDATQSASHCALSMPAASYTVTIDEPIVSPVDYSTMTIRQLKALCKSRGIKRYSSLRKHELVELLQH